MTSPSPVIRRLSAAIAAIVAGVTLTACSSAIAGTASTDASTVSVTSTATSATAALADNVASHAESGDLAYDADAAVTITTAAGLSGLRGSEDVLGTLLAAIDSGRAVQFSHRPSPAEAYVTRTVEPWGVLTARGRWYLIGHDRDRDATRTFRLSRIGSDVTATGPAGAVTRPPGVDLRGLVNAAIGETPSGIRAVVWVADGRATSVRRAGAPLGPRKVGNRPGELIELELDSTGRLAREIAGHGADALVIEPQELRDDVCARLAAHAGVRA